MSNQFEWQAVFRVIKHEVIPLCGSYEVRFADGRESKFFYGDDLPSRRLRGDSLTSEQAREQARAICQGSSG
jgi:hypothetical protein